MYLHVEANKNGIPKTHQLSPLETDDDINKMKR